MFICISSTYPVYIFSNGQYCINNNQLQSELLIHLLSLRTDLGGVMEQHLHNDYQLRSIASFVINHHLHLFEAALLDFSRLVPSLERGRCCAQIEW